MISHVTPALRAYRSQGAVLVGGRVTNTIKDGIIPANTFEGNAGVQLLAFTCASVASSGTR